MGQPRQRSRIILILVDNSQDSHGADEVRDARARLAHVSSSAHSSLVAVSLRPASCLRAGRSLRSGIGRSCRSPHVRWSYDRLTPQLGPCMHHRRPLQSGGRIVGSLRVKPCHGTVGEAGGRLPGFDMLSSPSPSAQPGPSGGRIRSGPRRFSAADETSSPPRSERTSTRGRRIADAHSSCLGLGGER